VLGYTLRPVPKHTVDLDQVFFALSDATRRAVLARLSMGAAAVGELAEHFDMALPSFLHHLKVLEQSGLVRSTKTGRVRTCHMSPRPLHVAEGWMSGRRTLWERRQHCDVAVLDRVAPSNRKKNKP
jgi:DNA-binding transcriptional ArsR family regulator